MSTRKQHLWANAPQRGTTPGEPHLSSLSNELELFRLALNTMINGTVITDPDGNILFFSKAFGEFVGLNAEEQIGKRCLDIIPTSRMHIVGKTGIPEINDIQVLNGKERVVQRIPLQKNGKVVGVVSQVVFKDKDEITHLVRRLSLMKSKVKLYENVVATHHHTRYSMDSFIGNGRDSQEMKKKALRAAKTALPVLIVGENGTGKEVLAQAIHSASQRADKPFVRINCANIPRELFESELFGHESGAFTGASSVGRMGRFEMANNGTVFLDEIGEVPLDMQVKLLNVLEEKAFYRVGGSSLVHVDFRVISATNQDIRQYMLEGKFRKDLFYRLSTINISIKPLRERSEDIEPIVQSILDSNASACGTPQVFLSPAARRLLLAYSWPGNVRELNNCMECALVFCESNTIEPTHLSIEASALAPTAPDTPSEDKDALRSRKRHVERETILSALEACQWHKTRAAQTLGIHRSLLYRKLRELGIGVARPVQCGKPCSAQKQQTFP